MRDPYPVTLLGFGFSLTNKVLGSEDGLHFKRGTYAMINPIVAAAIRARPLTEPGQRTILSAEIRAMAFSFPVRGACFWWGKIEACREPGEGEG